MARRIDEILQTHAAVVIESLGGSEGFERLRSGLQRKYDVKYVRVRTPLETCLQRVRSRDSADHIDVSDAQVEKYNAIADRIEMDWSAEIINEPFASEADILKAIDRL